MSAKQMGMVWDVPGLNHSEMLILLAVADSADHDGYCWPSVATIAKRSRFSTRQAQRIMNALEARGLIERRARTGRSSEIWLHLDSPQNELISDAVESRGTEGVRQDVTPPMTPRCHPTPDTQMSPITVNEPSSEPSYESKDSPQTSAETAESEPGEKLRGPGTTDGNQHWELLQVCTGLNGGDADNPPRSPKQLKVFQRMLKKHAFDDVKACMEWMATDSFWRVKKFDAMNVEKNIDKFLMGGRPTSMSRASPGRSGNRSEFDPAASWLKFGGLLDDEPQNVWDRNESVIDVTATEIRQHDS